MPLIVGECSFDRFSRQTVIPRDTVEIVADRIVIANGRPDQDSVPPESRLGTARAGWIRLERVSGETGLPINSIVTVACMEWLETHLPTEAATSRHWQHRGLFQRLVGRRHGATPDRFSPEARRALARAEDEARRFSHLAIGPHHLLLALVSETPDVGIDHARLADEVRRMYGQGAAPPPDEIRLTAEAKRAIEIGVQKVRRPGLVQAAHLLLGLLE